jgi:GT2 family glycosyltransferase
MPVSFSVVIPTRSRVDSLARCLEGLQPQVQGTTAEIIVTDDGDDAGSRDMIAARFPAILWTAGPRRGPAANRNHGAALATGDFIVFVDDDVVPSAGLLAGYEQAVIPSIHVYEGRTTCNAGLRSPLETSPVNQSGGCLWSCNMMVRRSFWQEFGGFDTDFPFPHMEDIAFRECLKAAGERFVFVPVASVDHPPRHLPPASSRIRHHESSFIYQYKYFGKAPSMRLFWSEFANYYLRLIVKREKGRDSLLAIGSICLEAYGVLKHWRGWDEKHRHLAENPVLTRRSNRAKRHPGIE